MGVLKAKAINVENVRSIADNTRNHSVVCDLTTSAGGTDSGPTALELTLMSLADCGVTIFSDVCKKSSIEPGKIQVDIEAEKNPESPLIGEVKMKVRVESSVRKELVEAAWRRTEANCPVLLIFKGQIPVNVELEVNSKT